MTSFAMIRYKYAFVDNFYAIIDNTIIAIIVVFCCTIIVISKSKYCPSLLSTDVWNSFPSVLKLYLHVWTCMRTLYFGGILKFDWQNHLDPKLCFLYSMLWGIWTKQNSVPVKFGTSKNNWLWSSCKLRHGTFIYH